MSSNVRGCHPPDQIAPVSIQPGLECLRGWEIHNFSGSPAPLPRHPLRKKFLLMSNLNFHSISFKQFILPCPVTIRSQKKSVFLIISSLSTLEGAMRSHCSLLFFSKLNQLYSLGLSSSPSFFRTLGCISHGPTALYTFRLMRNSRTCSSFTVGGVLLPWPL